MPASRPRRARRLLTLVASTLAAAMVVGAAWVLWHTRDRHRGYTVRLELVPTSTRGQSLLKVGFGRQKITPDLSRPVWLAGFANGRKATAVHDDLWAVAAVIDDGSHRIAIV